eukprot:1178922-Prorocentrum_minimum.AAC.5
MIEGLKGLAAGSVTALPGVPVTSASVWFRGCSPASVGKSSCSWALMSSQRRFTEGGGAVLVAVSSTKNNKIRLTGINWKIVSTYEPKIMLTHSPA